MKLQILSIIARLMGVQFHVDGLPYGATLLKKQGPFGSSCS
jgi:hypothetical protein